MTDKKKAGWAGLGILAIAAIALWMLLKRKAAPPTEGVTTPPAEGTTITDAITTPPEEIPFGFISIVYPAQAKGGDLILVRVRVRLLPLVATADSLRNVDTFHTTYGMMWKSAKYPQYANVQAQSLDFKAPFEPIAEGIVLLKLASYYKPLETSLTPPLGVNYIRCRLVPWVEGTVYEANFPAGSILSVDAPITIVA
jgi:hypothetical protein